VDNAIQKAIDEALSKTIDGTTDSITITVAAGTYNGDIVIGTSKDVDTVTTTTYKDVDGKVMGTTETAGTRNLYNLNNLTSLDLSKFKLIIVADDAGTITFPRTAMLSSTAI